MQLIQIGEPQPKTVLQMIEEIANRQFDEIEQLKRVAQIRRSTRGLAQKRRSRCISDLPTI